MHYNSKILKFKLFEKAKLPKRYQKVKKSNGF